jgi:phosphoserine phosphatase RsbU/P
MPARSVGGDLYDVILDGERLFFLVGDVAGKGVPAALFMAVTKTLFRATIQGEPSLGAALGKVNRELCRDNERSMFVTAFAGWLDLRTGDVEFGNAGHNLPYRVGRDLRVRPVTGAHGVAMGILADHQYTTETLRLEPGEALFLCTDGVLEALDVRGEQFGATRLMDQLVATARAPAEVVVRELVSAISEFTKGARQFDDITVMSLRYGTAS